MQNRVFFPQSAFDAWLVDETIELAGNELTIRAGGGRTYRIVEAVRVLREVTGSPDPNDLVGKVKSTLFLQELGAELLESSMILGEQAYDVIPGWLGAPTKSKPPTNSTGVRDSETDAALADEVVLVNLLQKTA